MNTIEERYLNGAQGGGEALPPGSTLLSGQYEILRYLSSGGFGITYLAKDSLYRTVVIKECFPEAFCARINRTVRARTQNYHSDFRSTVALFIREAHALSRLDHPSVVGVHQVFEDNETAYMALDLVDGKDLLQVIETRAPVLTPPMVHSLTLKLLDAIGHVHSQDLLHRDISPDNILIDKGGHPVLIDFGAAREEASRKSRILSSVLVVKDGYSPQEFYVAGSAQSPSSDLYALAATLVHLITGAAPVSSQARLAALANEECDLYEPLLGRVTGYDDVFLAAIDQAMNIAPSKRIQSAQDWTLMIDDAKRIAHARSQALNDKMIDQTVINLVESAKLPPIDERRALAKRKEIRQQVRHGRKAAPHDVSAASTAARASRDAARPTEDLRRFDAFDAAPESGAAQSLAEQTTQPSETPYARVTSRALAAAKERAEQKEPLIVPSRRMSRYATVPVVFCAYLFYGHTALQYDAVQAATLEPILSFGEGFGSISYEQQSPVVVRRGTGS